MVRSQTLATAFLAGALFGVGLAVSGMTEPDKVLNFLDLFGHWDPSLALVMGAALAVALPGFRWAQAQPLALCGDALGEFWGGSGHGRRQSRYWKARPK